jgi:hypothetical protein
MGVGPASVLAEYLRQERSIRSRVVRLGIAQRGAPPLPSEREQSIELGHVAAASLIEGTTGTAFGPGGSLALDELRPRELVAPHIDSEGVVKERVVESLDQWSVQSRVEMLDNLASTSTRRDLNREADRSRARASVPVEAQPRTEMSRHAHR